MAKRKPITPKIRFEVFKRDKFICQYCGGKAPDAILHVDHIHPVKEGGGNDIMNLITACSTCNGGKGKRLVTDDSVVELQRKQIEELQERREQLEMMLKWRDELKDLNEQEVNIISDHIGANYGFIPNQNGRLNIRRWLKSFSYGDVINAIDGSFETYAVYQDDKITQESWGKAFNKVPAVARIQIQQAERPYLRDLFYIQGIVRKRSGIKWYKCIEPLERAYLAGVSISRLTQLCREVDSEEDFEDGLAHEVIMAQDGGKNGSN